MLPLWVICLSSIATCLCLWICAKLDALGRQHERLGRITVTGLAGLWILSILSSITLPYLLSPEPLAWNDEVLVWKAAIFAPGLLLVFRSLRHRVMQKCGLNIQRLLHNLALYLGYHLIATMLFLQSMGGRMEDPLGNPGTLSGSTLGALGIGWMEFALVALLSVGWLSYRTSQEAAQRCGLQRTSLKRVSKGIGLGIAANAAVGICILGIFFLLQHQAGLPIDGLPPARPLSFTLQGMAVLLLITFGASVSEELLFRGAVQPRLGIFWTSLIFTSMHVQYSLLGIASIFGLSLILGNLAQRYGLWAAIGLHGFNNLFVALRPNLAAYLASQEEKGYLTSFQILSVALLIIGLAICCSAVYRWCCQKQMRSRVLRYGRYTLLGLWSLFLVGGVVGRWQYLMLKQEERNAPVTTPAEPAIPSATPSQPPAERTVPGI